MNELYLKAANEQELIAALPFARTDDSEWISATHEFSLNVVGVFYTPAVYEDFTSEDDKPVIITTPIALEGFHANIRCNDSIKELIDDSIIIDTPATPNVAWL